MVASQKMWIRVPPASPLERLVIVMDTRIRNRVIELLKYRKLVLECKAEKMRIENIENAGKVKLAILIAVKEHIGYEV